MPIVAPSPPPNTAQVRPLRGVHEASPLQGQEGAEVQRRLLSVQQQWESPESHAIMSPWNDDFDYVSPPPQLGRVRVRFRPIGTGRPHPYPLDDAE